MERIRGRIVRILSIINNVMASIDNNDGKMDLKDQQNGSDN